MDRLTALKEIFEVENIYAKVQQSCKLITADKLLQALVKEKANLRYELNISAKTLTKYLKTLWPERPTSSNTVGKYLLGKYGLKYCFSCAKVKEIDQYYNNATYSDGLSTYCKSCQYLCEKPTSVSRQAKYKAAKLERTPDNISDEEFSKITEFYLNCPQGYHVDHIVPLQGKEVSGLHVLCNLQYLPAKENLSKSNKFNSGII